MSLQYPYLFLLLENLAKCWYLEHYSCRDMCRVVCGCSVVRVFVFRHPLHALFLMHFPSSLFLFHYHMVPCYSVRPFVRPFVR